MQYCADVGLSLTFVHRKLQSILLHMSQRKYYFDMCHAEGYLHANNDTATKSASAGGFKLQQRAQHVFSEALRVPQFKEACRQQCSEEEKLQRLGQLMDESQESCRSATRNQNVSSLCLCYCHSWPMSVQLSIWCTVDKKLQLPPSFASLS